MPADGLSDWMNMSEEERKQAEGDMKQQWDAWLVAHKDAVQNTIGLGKTKKVTASGIEDAKNGLMLTSYVAAESLEEAAEIFKEHPHLQIPGAVIEVMETSQVS